MQEKVCFMGSDKKVASKVVHLIKNCVLMQEQTLRQVPSNQLKDPLSVKIITL